MQSRVLYCMCRPMPDPLEAIRCCRPCARGSPHRRPMIKRTNPCCFDAQELSNQTSSMGNCLFRKRAVEVEEMIKVITSNGGVMELYAPITAECITNEFPGHAIYTTRNHCSPPLHPNEHLRVGRPYFLLPKVSVTEAEFGRPGNNYRMSFDQSSVYTSDHHLSQRTEPRRYSSKGVWKVKLVISPEQLGEILTQEDATRELIESVRTVAKCGNNIYSLGNSDKWNL